MKYCFAYADGRMPVAMTTGAGRYYLAYDQVGSLRAVLDAQGSVVKRIAYDSFGNVLEDTNPALTLPFGFAGGLYDADTGLLRFGFRDYAPDTGRWTAKDPIGFAGGDTDLFQYVQSDPVNLIDVDGEYATAAVAPLVTYLTIMDGPLPFGDAIGTAILIGAGVLDLYDYAKNINSTPCPEQKFDDTPDTNPSKFRRVNNSPALKNMDDGSIWEKDLSKHGGKQWKRWKNEKLWERRAKQNSIWPDGRVRK